MNSVEKIILRSGIVQRWKDYKMEISLDTRNRHSLPANLCAWLGGHKFKAGRGGSTGLEEFAKEHPSLCNYLSEELDQETQKLVAENTLLRSKLNETSFPSSSQVSELLSYSSKIEELKRQISDLHMAAEKPSNSPEDLASLSYEVLLKQANELSKFVPLPNLKGSPDDLHKNLHLLAASNYSWDAYLTSLRNQVKDVLRTSQFTLFCLMLTSKADSKLYSEADSALRETDQVLLDSDLDLSRALKNQLELECLKLKFMQLERQKGAVDLKESVIKQNNILHLCSSFAKEMNLKTSAKYPAVIDWSANTLANSLEAQEKILSELFEACTSLRAERTQMQLLEEIKEKDLRIQSLEREKLILLGSSQGLSGEEIAIKLSELEKVDTSFQGNLDIIKQLTTQNNELLGILLEVPGTYSKRRSFSLSKILEKTKQFHANTEEIDIELNSLQSELAGGLKSPNLSNWGSFDASVEKLAFENHRLKKDLVETEAKHLLLKQSTRKIGKNPQLALYEGKIKEKEKQLRDLMREKQTMMDFIDRLKRNNTSLNVQLRNQKSVKDQLRTLNTLHSERESLITGMKSQMAKQKLKAQAAINETKYKKLGFLKTIGKLTASLRKLTPSFNEAEPVTKELEDEICANAKNLEKQTMKLQISLDEKTAEVDAAKQNMKTLEERIEKLRGDKRELKKLVEIAHKTFSDDPKQVFNKVPKELQETKGKLDNLIGTYAKLTDEKNKLLQIVSTSSAQISDLETNAKTIKDQNTQLQENLDKVTQEIQEVDTHIQITRSLEQALLEKEAKKQQHSPSKYKDLERAFTAGLERKLKQTQASKPMETVETSENAQKKEEGKARGKSKEATTKAKKEKEEDLKEPEKIVEESDPKGRSRKKGAKEEEGKKEKIEKEESKKGRRSKGEAEEIEDSDPKSKKRLSKEREKTSKESDPKSKSSKISSKDSVQESEAKSRSSKKLPRESIEESDPKSRSSKKLSRESIEESDPKSKSRKKEPKEEKTEEGKKSKKEHESKKGKKEEETKQSKKKTKEEESSKKSKREPSEEQDSPKKEKSKRTKKTDDVQKSLNENPVEEDKPPRVKSSRSKKATS